MNRSTSHVPFLKHSPKVNFRQIYCVKKNKKIHGLIRWDGRHSTLDGAAVFPEIKRVHSTNHRTDNTQPFDSATDLWSVQVWLRLWKAGEAQLTSVRCFSKSDGNISLKSVTECSLSPRSKRIYTSIRKWPEASWLEASAQSSWILLSQE